MGRETSRRPPEPPAVPQNRAQRPHWPCPAREERGTAGKGRGTEAAAAKSPRPRGTDGAGGGRWLPPCNFLHRPLPPRRPIAPSLPHRPPPSPRAGPQPHPVWGLCPRIVATRPRRLCIRPRTPRPPLLYSIDPGPLPRPGQRGWASGTCVLQDPDVGIWNPRISGPSSGRGPKVLKCVDVCGWNVDTRAGAPTCVCDAPVALGGAPLGREPQDRVEGTTAGSGCHLTGYTLEGPPSKTLQ